MNVHLSLGTDDECPIGVEREGYVTMTTSQDRRQAKSARERPIWKQEVMAVADPVDKVIAIALGLQYLIHSRKRRPNEWEALSSFGYV